MPQHNQPETLARLVCEVLASAKYRDISPDVIQHIGAQELGKRRNHKEALKHTRSKLHQVSGAYFAGNEDYAQWLNALQQVIQVGEQSALRQLCLDMMRHHASTRERLPILEQFYSTCMADLAPVHSVLDIACGLNPLAIPWMPLAAHASYYACDIHLPMLDFLAQYMTMLGIRGQTVACDVLQNCPTHEVDVALVLKTLPCLEQIDKQATHALLHSLHARSIIVSFPIHSLSGKGKGMVAYYDTHFRELVGNEPWHIRRYDLATELVFVVRK